MTVISSASGLLAMLDEEEDALKLHALKNLNLLVDQFWAEISANITTIESLYEDETFGERELAALLASKVFYHLGELNDSLLYALGAGKLFNVSEESEYVHTLIAKCIDDYVELNNKAIEGKEDVSSLDPRLVSIVEQMMDKCISDNQFEQTIGIALECRRLDKVEEAILKSDDISTLLAYCLNASHTIVKRREFRQSVLRMLVKLYQNSQTPDYVNICQCLMFLEDPAGVAHILENLLKGDESATLMAYQVAFDLFENEFQQFLLNVRNLLPDPLANVTPSHPDTSANPGQSQDQVDPPSGVSSGAPLAMDTDEASAAPAIETQQIQTKPMDSIAGESQNQSQTKAESSSPNQNVLDPNDASVQLSPEILSFSEKLSKLKSILSGETPINLNLQFLYSNNKSDLQILKNIKQSIEMRNSVCHSATIYANALMHAGTTVDTFLRENLDWLSRATNWAKFSATAGLGVIHKGHLQQGRSLMAPYLPQNGVSGSPYSEGGALYALGIIHANHGEGIKQFLLESLRNTSNEVIQHGACLGLGLAALGTSDEEVYEEIKNILYTDSAVAGEAAGIAMGLLMVGTASEKATEMLAYAHDTQHEKIIRGLALGVALVVYRREEEAETLIEQMTRDQDPILRYGGMYALAMAYSGTGNNAAIRQLLHFAVSDVSDDVRRAAVMALGFVLSARPDQTPRIVSLLSESYNPHVRYGAAMAVGISCAGTGVSDAISLLEPLTLDPVDFVRQGALLALSMVLMQVNEHRDTRAASFRRHLDKVIHDKHEDTMCKKGAILASGLLDAGGRNVSIRLRSKTSHDRLTATIGMAVFTQYWYWYPLLYFINLSFAPTSFIGLQQDMRMPKLEVKSDCRPSLFGYPPAISTQTNAPVVKAPSAVLSTAARSKGKAKREGEGKSSKEESKEMSKKRGETENALQPMEVDSPSQEKKEASPEPTSELLSNPARVVPGQERYIHFLPDSHYKPLKNVLSGFVMLKNLKPDLPEEFVSNDSPNAPSNANANANANATDATADAASNPNAQAGGAAGNTGNNSAMDEDEPPPPDSFEFND